MITKDIILLPAFVPANGILICSTAVLAENAGIIEPRLSSKRESLTANYRLYLFLISTMLICLDSIF